MSDPTGDALAANERVVMDVARALQVAAAEDWDLQIPTDEGALFLARAAVAAYLKAMEPQSLAERLMGESVAARCRRMGKRVGVCQHGVDLDAKCERCHQKQA